VQKKDWRYGYNKLKKGLPREKRQEKKPGKRITKEER